MTENSVPYPLLIPIHELVSADETRIERDEEHMARLAADFAQRLKENPAEHPVQTPLRVIRREGKYLILAGNYRYLAALRVPAIRELPCLVVRGEFDEADILVEQAKDNELRKNYSPMERARNIVRLAELRNGSYAEAGRLLGISAPEVSKLLRVLKDYPSDLHGWIGEGDGKIPVTSAYSLSRLQPDDAKIRELSKQVVDGLLTRDAVEGIVAGILGKRTERKPSPLKVKLTGLELILSVFEVGQLRALLALVDAALLKLEKHGLPVQSLQQMLRTPPAR